MPEAATPAEILGGNVTNYARAEAFLRNADLLDVYTARSYLLASQTCALLAIAEALAKRAA